MENSLKNRVGERYKNNQGSWLTIIGYINNGKVTIEFDSGFIRETRMTDIKRGQVKDLLFPSVFNHGYVGIGNYKISENGKHTEAYIEWKSMLNRCYNPSSLKIFPTYEKCYVCDEWLNFQSFAEWYHKQNRPKGWQIDKDIVQIGNKVYCPSLCRFVPREINSLLVNSERSRGNYKQGVFSSSKNIFSSSISIDGKFVRLGSFKDENEAYNVYKKAKEENVKNVANKYKDKISEDIYNSLMKWSLQEEEKFLKIA